MGLLGGFVRRFCGTADATLRRDLAAVIKALKTSLNMRMDRQRLLIHELYDAVHDLEIQVARLDERLRVVEKDAPPPKPH
jgi:hypothetical protein